MAKAPPFKYPLRLRIIPYKANFSNGAQLLDGEGRILISGGMSKWARPALRALVRRVNKLRRVDRNTA